jgi:hypothetical protein
MPPDASFDPHGDDSVGADGQNLAGVIALLGTTALPRASTLTLALLVLPV